MSLGFSAPAMSGTAVSPRRVYENTAFQDMDSKPVLASLKMPNGGLRCRTQSPRAGDSSVQSPLSVSTPPMSPCASSPPSEDWIRRGFQTSPRAGGAGGPMRADIAAACQALGAVAEPMTHPGTDTGVMEHPLPHAKKNGGVPVFVMLPLDSIKWDNTVNRKKAMNASLQALKSAGVEGIMMDVWWGLVEREAPGQYNWDGYRELIEMIKRHGLKVQAVMSFHQCGGNVGDSVCIPLPKWAVEEIDRDNDLAYTDQWGRRNYEYVSLGVDTLPVLKGRSPVQCYADFMRSFKQNFKDLIGETIVEIQVGMGPAGELRYPSYPEANGTWRFPGIGAFQCYDKYMLADLKAAADQVNKPEWGRGGPTDAGSYNNWPEDTPFFKRDGGWSNEYGEFFLSWYSNMLLSHGERILGEAEAIFRNTGAKLSGKVAGIHWHYGTRSHAPELTAGYYNTRDRDGYESIAQLFARHGVVFNFTCIEMKDYEQPQDARCSPEGLIKQVIHATRKVGVPLAGENALMRFDEGAYSQILNSSSLRQSEDKPDAQIDPMCAFTFLRMCPEMFQSENWRLFVSFVKRMSEGSSSNSWEQVHREAEHFVHVTRPLVQEAAAFA